MLGGDLSLWFFGNVDAIAEEDLESVERRGCMLSGVVSPHRLYGGCVGGVGLGWVMKAKLPKIARTACLCMRYAQMPNRLSILVSSH